MSQQSFSLITAGNFQAGLLDANDAIIEGTTIELPESVVDLTLDSKEVLFESVEPGTAGQATDAAYFGAPSKISIKSKKFTMPWMEMLFSGAMAAFSQASGTVAFEEHTVAGLDGLGFNLGQEYIDWTTAVVLQNKRAVTLTDTGDKVGLVAHGFENGQKLRFSDIVSTTGLTANTTVYVVNKATDDFEVSLTLGGAAIALTTNGTANVYEVAAANSFGVSKQSLNTVYPYSTGTTPFALADVIYVSYGYNAVDTKQINIGTVPNKRIYVKGHLVNQNNPAQKFECYFPKLSAMSKTTFNLSSVSDFTEGTLEGTVLIADTTTGVGYFRPLFIN